MPTSETAASAPPAGTRTPPGPFGRALSHLSRAVQQQPALRRPGAYWNWLLANYELVARRSTVRAKPLKLIFDPTNYCQLECPLCPTGARVHDRSRGTAQRHLFEHLMEELGDYLFFVDFFNWGEPLLNPHTEDFIGIAARRGIVTALSSNFSLHLSDERLDRIVTSGLNLLIVSLDGASAQTYGMYRRQGHFDLVIDNMKRLIAIRNAHGGSPLRVDWQYLVFRFNEHEMNRASGLAREIGVDSLSFRAPFLDEGRYPLTDEDQRLIASWKPSHPGFDAARLNHAAISARPRCGWHYMATAINWDGTVTPCCTVWEKKDDFGQYSGNSPMEYQRIVNNDRFRAVRDSFAGRRPNDTGLVCDRCPTPGMMGYHHHLNHQVVLYSLAALMSRLRGRRRVARHEPPAASRRQHSNADTVPPPSPVQFFRTRP